MTTVSAEGKALGIVNECLGQEGKAFGPVDKGAAFIGSCILLAGLVVSAALRGEPK